MVKSQTEFLLKKRVKVIAIEREGGWLGKGHDGTFMYSGCKRGYCLPIDKDKGTLVPVLNEEEREFFEDRLSLPKGELSFYRKGKDNFWAKFRINVDKHGMSLNLADPMDNLRWRVLRIHSEIAPSWADRYNSAAYKFAIVDEDVVIRDRVTLSEMKKKAYRFLGQIEGSADKMCDFLRIMGRKPVKDSTREYFISEIDKMIEDDKMLKKMLFIEDAVDSGIIRKLGKGVYAIVGIDDTFSQVELIEFLKEEGKHQEIYMRVRDHVENYKRDIK